MIRVLVVLLLCALVCPGPVKAQVPNLLVSVQLQGVGAVDVEAVLTADSTPLLPAAPVSELLGLPPPTSQWVTVAQLQKQFPPIQVQWIPRQLTVLIQDDLFALPASRRTRDALIRQAQGAAPYAVTRSGPFAAVAGDNLGKTLVDSGTRSGDGRRSPCAAARRVARAPPSVSRPCRCCSRASRPGRGSNRFLTATVPLGAAALPRTNGNQR